jgi:hypothetical protein
MGRIEDLYLQDEAYLKKSQTEKDIFGYNQDIDIINEVTKEILTKAETYRPVDHGWKTPSESHEHFVSWNICLDTNEYGPKWSINLLSNGRLLYSRTDYKEHEGDYIDLKHVTDLANENLENLIMQKYRLRESIVNMAMSLFKIKPKSNWGYVEYGKTETYPETTNRLLSEILEELKQQREKKLVESLGLHTF